MTESYEHLTLFDASDPEIYRRTLHDRLTDFLTSHGFSSIHTGSIVNNAHFHTRQHRGDFRVLKGSYPKTRTINIPNGVVRTVHEWLTYEFFSDITSLPISEQACGIGNRGIPQFIAPHTESRYRMKLDLAHAYDSVSLTELASLLATHGIATSDSSMWHDILSYFVSVNGEGLATGAPLSPLFFAIALSSLDADIAQYCQEHELHFTRYFDDILISSSDPIGTRKAKSIKSLIRDRGFDINQHKVRYHDKESDGPFLIAGQQINPSGAWHIQNRYLKNMIRFYNEALEALQSDGELPLKTIGEVRGFHGYLSYTTSCQERALYPLERRAFDLYHDIEYLYRLYSAFS